MGFHFGIFVAHQIGCEGTTIQFTTHVVTSNLLNQLLRILIYTPEVKHNPWKMMIGKPLSFWEGNFSGSMFNFGGVSCWSLLRLGDLLKCIKVVSFISKVLTDQKNPTFLPVVKSDFVGWNVWKSLGQISQWQGPQGLNSIAILGSCVRSICPWW